MVAIIFENLSIDFPVYGTGKRLLKKELIRLATGGMIKSNEDKTMTVKALSNISLRIENGGRLGIIGKNGVGKTTLLRIIAKIYEPTAGSITVEGHVTPLLDMMVGFDDSSTGYEIIKIRGLIQGLSSKEINNKTDYIADYTELGDYLEMPIRTYSSGMKMRLAFGIAASSNPEILLLDEIFGVGDETFLVKAKKRMEEMIEESSIVVFTSHSLELIKRICSDVLWLDKGSIRFFGDVDEGLERYRESVIDRES
ncbi:MAG: ABC transporter ATP-binding protein [Chlamydiota bacterium]